MRHQNKKQTVKYLESKRKEIEEYIDNNDIIYSSSIIIEDLLETLNDNIVFKILNEVYTNDNLNNLNNEEKVEFYKNLIDEIFDDSHEKLKEYFEESCCD